MARRRRFEVLEGGLARCAVDNGACCARLERHHVHPLACGGADDASNLRVLCRRHHALVERYYWWRRQRLAPELTRAILVLARRFDRKLIPPLQVPPLQQRSKDLWAELNALPDFANALWWQAAFAGALKWMVGLELTREVAPANAIIEEPWFRSSRESYEQTFTGTGP